MTLRSSRTEFLDGVIGFLSAFAVGLVLVIGYSIVKGAMSPWPSLVLLGLLVVIWLLWRYRSKDAAERARLQQIEDEESR